MNAEDRNSSDEDENEANRAGSGAESDSGDADSKPSEERLKHEKELYRSRVHVCILILAPVVYKNMNVYYVDMLINTLLAYLPHSQLPIYTGPARHFNRHISWIILHLIF